MDILAGLNPAQKEAVEAINGPVLIVAGPGSGKTRVIAHRIAYLVKVTGISPYHIVAVTFTNKAAREMKERVYQLLGSAVDSLTLGTFHAICARILRVEAEHLGIDKGFAIYDDSDQLSVMKRVLQELGLDPKLNPPRPLLNGISAAKSTLITPGEFVAKNYHEEVVKRVYERYHDHLRKNNAMDFDDLLMSTVRLFRNHPDVLAKYQNRYVHVMIDEFQDTNIAQYELARQLAGKYRNLCVVGDPDQSIYAWRFADVRNIMFLERDFPELKKVFLEQNYRSTKKILEAAQGVIVKNTERHKRELWTENEPGPPIVVAETYNEQDEAQYVVSEIDRLIKSKEFKAGDFAVMYRTNAQSRALEEAFMRYGMPYRLVGGTRFYERKEVKDAIAYLRVVQNPYDSISLGRIINVPPRSIGQRTVDELMQWAQQQDLPTYTALQLVAEKAAAGKEALSGTPFNTRVGQALSDFLAMIDEFITKAKEVDLVALVDLVLDRTGYKRYIKESENGDERWENVLELRRVALDYKDLRQEGLLAFLEEAALVSDVDELKERADAVTLITLHQAKGLEFPVVFIVGMEEGLLPHVRSLEDPTGMEEERRVCYVGMTRAEKRLYLVRAFRRSLMGSSKPYAPSRFLADIPKELIATKVEASEPTMFAMRPAPVARTSPKLSSLVAGDRVRHPKFGDGVVVSSTPTKDDEEVVIAFKGMGVKRLLLSLAPLEKVPPQSDSTPTSAGA